MQAFEIFTTEDGSDSVFIRDQKLTYHSRHGAITESRHIFIQAGLMPLIESGQGPLRIFEMGFGTGLNALLTMAAADMYQTKIIYHAIEAFPLPESIVSSLNYPGCLDSSGMTEKFQRMHAAAWNEEISLGGNFHLLKWKGNLLDFEHTEKYHLVYFDAFSPDIQPDLWTFEIFKKINRWLEPGAALLTYSTKGEIRRALARAGFAVEKLKGPPGKREITRATKNIKT